MAGFLIKINGKELVSISNEGLNIISVQVQGDLIGQELSVINVFGGYYGDDIKDKHLIWVTDKEICKGDEIEISFLSSLGTSYPGKTIEELYPDRKNEKFESQSMEELFQEIKKQPKIRGKLSFKLVPPSEEVIHSAIGEKDYSFILIAMWKWFKPDVAQISITSNTMEGVVKNEAGTNHARVSLEYGQGVKFSVGT